MATAAEIRNKAAKKLGLFGTGQTLQSAVSADVDAAYAEVYAELKALSIATFTSNSVPNHLVASVVSLVAGARVNEYGLPPEKYARIVRDADDAERRIREMIAPRKHGVTKIEAY